MASSDSGQRAGLRLVSGLRDNLKGHLCGRAPESPTGVGMLGGYYVNGMYYSRKEVMVLANGEQQEALNTK